MHSSLPNQTDCSNTKADTGITNMQKKLFFIQIFFKYDRSFIHIKYKTCLSTYVMCKQINQNMTSHRPWLMQLNLYNNWRKTRSYLPYKVNLLHRLSAHMPMCVLTSVRLTYSCLFRGSGLALWSNYLTFFVACYLSDWVI